MSSDSELDEFYDAEDSTPKQSFNLKKIQENVNESGDDEILEQERKLLELKKKQEERRRKEDEEYQQMLQDLQKKKKGGKQKDVQNLSDTKLQELEKRRKKLADMRQRMFEDSIESDSKHNSDTDDEMLDDKDQNENDVDSDSSEKGGRKVTDKNTEHHVSSNSEKFSDLSENINSSLPEKVKPNKMIPELVKEDISENACLPESDSIVEDIIKETHVCSDDEPDIVKSTKTKTPPNTLAPQKPAAPPQQKPAATPPSVLSLPKAPPRKKKKEDRNSLADDDGQLSSGTSSPREWDTLSPGLPIPTPTSTVESLTKDLEFSLDLRSALGGGRHVNAEDAERDAVNSDQDSPRQPESDHGIESSEKKSSPDNAEDTKIESPRRDKTASLPRPRSNSGRLLTDQEILETVIVKNLDTGEALALSVAEDKIPSGINPLALHIMRRTKEYSSDGSMAKDDVKRGEYDQEDTKSTSGERGAKKKVAKFKKLLGKSVSKMKNMAGQVLHSEDTAVEEEVSCDGKIFKIKASSHNKGPHDFNQIQLLQDLSGVHTGAIWVMKFSHCGRLLATGGQDSTLRIWVVRSAYNYFEMMKQKYADVRVSPAPSHESINTLVSESSAGDTLNDTDDDDSLAPFMAKPFCTYRGHSADLLDVSWSKNDFILSSSMDKTVRLWHISRRECLCTFQHVDFVTAIVFHPKDDRYFLSGSLDGKLRLWNIPEKKVTLWNEVSGPSNLITTANFCHNGKFAVAGTYDGKCIFYSTEQLKYYTQVHVRSTRGKNAQGRKITGIEPLLGEDKILVTSNDSRIRLYDLRDLTLSCKYKGCSNNSSQIKASFSAKAKYIICGSEDHFVYVWKTQHDYYKFSSARRDRNDYWEAIKVHNAVVTAAIFAPNPALLRPNEEEATTPSKDISDDQGQIIISADFSGAIKVIQNQIKN